MLFFLFLLLAAAAYAQECSFPLEDSLGSDGTNTYQLQIYHGQSKVQTLTSNSNVTVSLSGKVPYVGFMLVAVPTQFLEENYYNSLVDERLFQQVQPGWIKTVNTNTLSCSAQTTKDQQQDDNGSAVVPSEERSNYARLNDEFEYHVSPKASGNLTFLAFVSTVEEEWYGRLQRIEITVPVVEEEDKASLPPKEEIASKSDPVNTAQVSSAIGGVPFGLVWISSGVALMLTLV